MDFSARDRFTYSSYPKHKALLDAKMKLVKSKSHKEQRVSVKSFKDFCLADLSQVKFDVIVAKLPRNWSLDELQNYVQMDLLAENPSFLVLGCGGDQKRVTLARKLLKVWGFRRAEDIVWVKKSVEGQEIETSIPKRLGSCAVTAKDQVFLQTKQHFLVGIKGTIRRNFDTHIVTTNLDTDVIVTDSAEDFDFPRELFHTMERLCLGLKKLCLTFRG